MRSSVLLDGFVRSRSLSGPERQVVHLIAADLQLHVCGMGRRLAVGRWDEWVEHRRGELQQLAGSRTFEDLLASQRRALTTLCQELAVPYEEESEATVRPLPGPSRAKSPCEARGQRVPIFRSGLCKTRFHST